MKTIEFVVLAAFALFWLIFFLLLCYFASRKKRVDTRRDHWNPQENDYKVSHGQYMGAIGWFQRYNNRQNESKHELDLL